MKKTLMLIACLIAGMGVTNSSSGGSPREKDGGWPADPTSQMVFFAVLEGLYTDGVPNEIVDIIIPPKEGRSEPVKNSEFFVPLCPLCDPAYQAFRLYRSRKEFFTLKPPESRPVDTFGQGLEAKIVEALKSPNVETRREAVQSLINTWVKRKLDSMRLTDAEKQTWAKNLEGLRKKGMQMLKFNSNRENSPYKRFKNCAICDGSVGACPVEK